MYCIAIRHKLYIGVLEICAVIKKGSYIHVTGIGIMSFNNIKVHSLNGSLARRPDGWSAGRVTSLGRKDLGLVLNDVIQNGLKRRSYVEPA